LAFLLRFGGMALPQSVIIDMPWHMKWLRTLLAGDWQSLYFPGGLSAVPREWGMELLIPKSPLFYVAFAPLDLLPFDLATSTRWLICLLDSTVALFIFWFARQVGAAQVAAILSASLYAFMPLAFRAFAYGILPTILAQCLVLVVYVLWLGMWPRLRAATSMGYVWRVPATLAIAWLIAILAYYGLYISPVLASTQALLAPTGGQASTVRWPGGLADLLAWTADYVVSLLPLLLAVIGFVLLWRMKLRAVAGRALVLLTVWAAILPVFFLANYRVDMIGKHLFFTMVPVAVAGGVALFAFARLGRWGTIFTTLALSLIAWQGVVFWIERLVRASS
jgi:hypothetical protein